MQKTHYSTWPCQCLYGAIGPISKWYFLTHKSKWRIRLLKTPKGRILHIRLGTLAFEIGRPETRGATAVVGAR